MSRGVQNAQLHGPAAKPPKTEEPLTGQSWNWAVLAEGPKFPA